MNKLSTSTELEQALHDEVVALQAVVKAQEEVITTLQWELALARQDLNETRKLVA